MCHQRASRSRTRFRPTLLPLLVRVLPFITHYCFYFFLFNQLWWRFSTSQRWPRRPYAIWSHASLPTVAIPTEGHAPLSEELGGISGKKSIFPPPIDVDVVFCVCKFPTSHLWSAARSFFFYFRKTDERVCVPDPLNNKFQACVPTLLFKRWRESKLIFDSIFRKQKRYLQQPYRVRNRSRWCRRAEVTGEAVRWSAGTTIPLPFFFESFTLFSSVFSASSWRRRHTSAAPSDEIPKPRGEENH